MIKELKPCPFCGQQPEVEPWHGGAPTKVMITCVGLHPEAGFIDCGPAPSATGETPAEAAASWNTRTAYDPDKRLREALEAVIAQLDEEQSAMMDERKEQYGSGFTADQRACIEEMFRNRRIGADRLGAALSHNGG